MLDAVKRVAVDGERDSRVERSGGCQCDEDACENGCTTTKVLKILQRREGGMASLCLRCYYHQG